MALLPVVLGIAATAAIAGPDPEVAVGAECDLAAVVIAPGLVKLQKDFLGIGIDLVDVGMEAETGDSGMETAGVGGGVVDVEGPTAGKVGGEGDAKQSSLATTADAVADVHERRLADATVVKCLDQTYLLDHIDASGTIFGVGEVNRISEAGHCFDQSDGRPGRPLLGLGLGGRRAGF